MDARERRENRQETEKQEEMKSSEDEKNKNSGHFDVFAERCCRIKDSSVFFYTGKKLDDEKLSSTPSLKSYYSKSHEILGPENDRVPPLVELRQRLE